MADDKPSLIIPNAKQVAKRSATLWTGYVALAIVILDYVVKWLNDDASAGLSPNARSYMLMGATIIGMGLRFWQQNLSVQESSTLKGDPQ